MAEPSATAAALADLRLLRRLRPDAELSSELPSEGNGNVYQVRTSLAGEVFIGRGASETEAIGRCCKKAVRFIQLYWSEAEKRFLEPHERKKGGGAAPPDNKKDQHRGQSQPLPSAAAAANTQRGEAKRPGQQRNGQGRSKGAEVPYDYDAPPRPAPPMASAGRQPLYRRGQTAGPRGRQPSPPPPLDHQKRGASSYASAVDRDFQHHYLGDASPLVPYPRSQGMNGSKESSNKSKGATAGSQVKTSPRPLMTAPLPPEHPKDIHSASTKASQQRNNRSGGSGRRDSRERPSSVHSARSSRCVTSANTEPLGRRRRLAPANGPSLLATFGVQVQQNPRNESVANGGGDTGAPRHDVMAHAREEKQPKISASKERSAATKKRSGRSRTGRRRGRGGGDRRDDLDGDMDYNDNAEDQRQSSSKNKSFNQPVPIVEEPNGICGENEEEASDDIESSEVKKLPIPMLVITSEDNDDEFCEFVEEKLKPNVPIKNAVMMLNELFPPPKAPQYKVTILILPLLSQSMYSHVAVKLTPPFKTMQVTSQTGPPNNPTFTMVCTISGKSFDGEGKSKKEAKLACSQKAIEVLYG
jgi:hypothetical protein